jgi:hypothetical protein
MVQGGASRRERTRVEDKWNENERKVKRSWNGAATHVPTCPTLDVMMPSAICKFALGELAKRGGPEAGT